jgi:hypothetical protein
MGLYAVKKELTKEDCICIVQKNHEAWKAAERAAVTSDSHVFSAPESKRIDASDYAHSAIAYGWEMCGNGDGETFNEELSGMGYADLAAKAKAEGDPIYGVDILLTRESVEKFLDNHKHLYAKFEKRDAKCRLDKDGEELDDREYHAKFDDEFDFLEQKEYSFLTSVKNLLADYPDSVLFHYNAG